MARQKASELRKLEMENLEERLAELRTELAKLRSSASRGTLGKASGKIRATKRNIARVLTVVNELKRGKIKA